MGRVSTCNSVYTECRGWRGVRAGQSAGEFKRNGGGERERERAGRIDSGQHPIKDKDTVETVCLARLPLYTETLLLQFHANRELDYHTRRMENLLSSKVVTMPIFEGSA